MKHKILSLLVLLLTAASGAWAKTDPNSVYWHNETWAGWAENVTTHTVGDITITCSGNAKAYESMGSGEPLAMEAGNNDAITFTSNGAPFKSIKIQVDTNSDPGVAGWTWVGSEWTLEWSGTPATSVTLSGCDIVADVITFTFGSAEAPIEVTPGSSANTWTFSMPASDVVLTPLYAPAAKWDVVENVEQQPAALEGIIAGQDAAIVTPGLSAQGTVMYAVTTTAEPAPALTAFSATVPTAKTYDDATTLYVWYYIQGHDTPDGQQATEENTFNDSEISATPLKVDILTNKFDLTLKPAPVKNMTVTVAGQAKTPTDEGKVEAVKMGSEVKVTAKEGYKFRKVKVKKGGAAGNAYLKWDADQKKLVATDIPAGATTVANADADVYWSAGTYVVEGNVTISGKIFLTGHVDLIIKDGAKLTAMQIKSYSSEKKNLRIYGQANQTGQLVVNCSNDDAINAINTLEVHSCQVKSTSTNGCGGFYYIPTFNVYGGSVDAECTATSGYGIYLADDGSMNIYGGDVKAVGKGNSYGIRGFDSTVTVYDGTLWAENAGNIAFGSGVTLAKDAGFTGKIETSDNGESWTEYTPATTPTTKYVRVGY